MKAFEYSLNTLAQRVQEGDYAAKRQMKETLEPSMARIVRRVLERGQATTSLERKILAAARRLAPVEHVDGNALDRPDTVSADLTKRTIPVSRNLCQMVVNRLWPGCTEDPLQTTLTA